MRFGAFFFIHTLFEAISKAFSLASYASSFFGIGMASLLFGEELQLQLLPCCRILPLRAFGTPSAIAFLLTDKILWFFHPVISFP